jgi:hypothetical protein
MTALPGQRMHYCGRCVSGEHELGIDTWDTRHCVLQRECCQCDCDCPYYRVLVEEPKCLRRRTMRRWSVGRRPPRGWAQQYLHEVLGPPILSPEEYLNR